MHLHMYTHSVVCTYAYAYIHTYVCNVYRIKITQPCDNNLLCSGRLQLKSLLQNLLVMHRLVVFSIYACNYKVI